ncbi:hypothetical protein SDRG_05929 [Saprolegnia diclina VS20]|uniref:Uncharacterized protein n=1 Tax=Saprolegnia diclina (strain VS20) TaxID=1156394 RepID=T0QRE8_SAPDV|nr:hypothetical protein SDRG_05929 [Saprolegnia diclina VS20]EQC36475.1 hypothetical protein SDRG_05929 [Saprolegnia diclina VS20]|eukprot:XP_008609896.1 hypothetical protein SDRG_05929 [Saprolegnia diclina VS20]
MLANTTDGNGSYIAQVAFANLAIVHGITPVPSGLDRTRINGAGSNLFCNALASSLNLTNGVSSYFGAEVPCNTNIGEWVYFSPEQVLLALLASGVNSDTVSLVPRVCSVETASPAQCRTSLLSASAFLNAYVPPEWVFAIRTQATNVQSDITALQVELATYAQDAVTRQLSLFHQPILDPNDVSMLFVGWTNAYDWAVGTREVVAFEGDVRAISVISAAFKPTSFVANAAEVPVNVVAYLRVFCQYISLLMLMVACTVLLYTVLNGFTTEGVNLLKINRVGGIVWVGRQLLFLRSATALCILSTATLQLHTFGSATFPIADRLDVSGSVDVVSKILAAGELGWLGYIFDDICMVFTQQYAGAYASKSSLVVWMLAAILSLAQPVAHHISLHIECEVVAFDYQVACVSGSLTIGSISRLLLLVGISVSISLSFFAYHRLRYTLPPLDERTSYMLPCGAKYLFRRRGWVVHRVYYMDYASAALAGLLVLPLRHRVYVFDVKAWRIRSFDTTHIHDETKFHPAARRLAVALPLLD